MHIGTVRKKIRKAELTSKTSGNMQNSRLQAVPRSNGPPKTTKTLLETDVNWNFTGKELFQVVKVVFLDAAHGALERPSRHLGFYVTCCLLTGVGSIDK
jgi:hypothetical protein